jgi:hypothetical protein
MGKIEDLADAFERHISLPWQRSLSGPQRVIVVIYDKTWERSLRTRKGEFENRATKAGHAWQEFDCTRIFAEWLAADDYRDAFFEYPEDLPMKLEGEFKDHVAGLLRDALKTAGDNTAVALTGIGSLYGFLHISSLVRDIEPDIQGRLVVFFPGSKDGDNYRLLDARDGWNYLATSISLHDVGKYA